MKRLVIISINLILLIAVIICFSATTVKADTQDKGTVESVYTSIKLVQGDTLESLEECYNTSGVYSRSEYISEIKRINGLYDDNIHAGCYLTVVCFSNQ